EADLVDLVVVDEVHRVEIEGRLVLAHLGLDVRAERLRPDADRGEERGQAVAVTLDVARPRADVVVARLEAVRVPGREDRLRPVDGQTAGAERVSVDSLDREPAQVRIVADRVV